MSVTLRNVDTGATRQVEEDSPEFKRLVALKAQDAKNPLWEETGSGSIGSGSYTQQLVATAPARALTADGDTIIGTAPFDGTVTGVTYVPEAAVTGDSTDTRTLTLVNKGQAGAGTTVIATLAFTTGVNGVAADEKAFTLSVVAGATTVVAGDVLEFVSTHGGSTGLGDPGGRVTVTVARS